jgi:hypothetical protein
MKTIPKNDSATLNFVSLGPQFFVYWFSLIFGNDSLKNMKSSCAFLQHQKAASAENELVITISATYRGKVMVETLTK